MVAPAIIFVSVFVFCYKKASLSKVILNDVLPLKLLSKHFASVRKGLLEILPINITTPLILVTLHIIK